MARSYRRNSQLYYRVSRFIILIFTPSRVNHHHHVTSIFKDLYFAQNNVPAARLASGELYLLIDRMLVHIVGF